MNFNPNDKNFSIWYSKNIKDSKNEKTKQAKANRCYLCGNNCSSYCNSHSIPQFILSNLSEIGEYSNYEAFAKFKINKDKTGKNNAGTFHTICNNCDSLFFKDYEDPSIYDSLKAPLKQEILYQIGIKNLLFHINKANEQLSSLYAQHLYFESVKDKLLRSTIDIQKLKEQQKDLMFSACKRLEFYEKTLAYDKWCYEEKYKAFDVILQEELNYNVPIAIQSMIPVSKGLSGEIINDFVNMMHFLHICVFPLNNKSLILLFCHSSGTEYDIFKKDLQKKQLMEQLEIINYMIFLFSEDYFCNTNILKRIEENKNLQTVCQYLSECDLSKPIVKIPNLLSREYSCPASI